MCAVVLYASWMLRDMVIYISPVSLLLSLRRRTVFNNEGSDGVFAAYDHHSGGSCLLVGRSFSPTTAKTSSCYCCCPSPIRWRKRSHSSLASLLSGPLQMMFGWSGWHNRHLAGVLVLFSIMTVAKGTGTGCIALVQYISMLFCWIARIQVLLAIVFVRQ